MQHLITQTSDYGSFKSGAYNVDGKWYRTTGIRTPHGWEWTLVMDNSTHPNLKALKSHLIAKLA